jgi:hypothetical protein
MLPFPISFILLPAVLGFGVGYVLAGRLARRSFRGGIRLGILGFTCVAPALTRGPGPAQLILGLVVGYLGIRMMGLSRRSGEFGKRRGEVAGILLDLLVPEDVLAESATPARRPLLTVVMGLAKSALCILLLVGGNAWRLWQHSLLLRGLDDLLVLLEVAVGAAGVHDLIVGVAGVLGRSVLGLQNHPLLSASLAEFWARRWNRMIQGNLRRAFFLPGVRAGRPERGLLAAFTASGILHVMAVEGAAAPSVVALPCAWVMAFFLLHGGLVFAEKRLGWHRASQRSPAHLFARARTLVLFVALSPLLLDPFANVTHVHGRTLDHPGTPSPWSNSSAFAQRTPP